MFFGNSTAVWLVIIDWYVILTVVNESILYPH